jgi:hypothetical protein
LVNNGGGLYNNQTLIWTCCGFVSSAMRETKSVTGHIYAVILHQYRADSLVNCTSTTSSHAIRYQDKLEYLQALVQVPKIEPWCWP